MGSIPGLGRPLGEENGNPLQYPCLESPMNRGVWPVTVYGVTRVGHDLTTSLPPKHKLAPGGSEGKECACNAGDLVLIPGSGRSPGEGNDYPFQNSCLENSMDKGVWWTIVHGVAESDTTKRLTLGARKAQTH